MITHRNLHKDRKIGRETEKKNIVEKYYETCTQIKNIERKRELRTGATRGWKKRGKKAREERGAVR